MSKKRTVTTANLEDSKRPATRARSALLQHDCGDCWYQESVRLFIDPDFFPTPEEREDLRDSTLVQRMPWQQNEEETKAMIELTKGLVQRMQILVGVWLLHEEVVYQIIVAPNNPLRIFIRSGTDTTRTDNVHSILNFATVWYLMHRLRPQQMLLHGYMSKAGADSSIGRAAKKNELFDHNPLRHVLAFIDPRPEWYKSQKLSKKRTLSP